MHYKLTLQLYRHTQHLCQHYPNSPVIFATNKGFMGWLFANPMLAMHHLHNHTVPNLRGNRIARPKLWPQGALVKAMASISICRVTNTVAPNCYPIALYTNPKTGALTLYPHKRCRQAVGKMVHVPQYLHAANAVPSYTKCGNLYHRHPYWL